MMVRKPSGSICQFHSPVADDYRIAYHRDHINAMKAAMFEDGAQVIGYLAINPQPR
jgi:beta-glucosidase/6-phospho-beta-glucosidase/beta-galactosidase